uniref:Muscarinic acetylcholine receptor DM1-like n=1 Tax=Drosophila rhopaloa TaxID=1041015 RepID=A0A6P4FU69_DRORH
VPHLDEQLHPEFAPKLLLFLPVSVIWSGGPLCDVFENALPTSTSFLSISFRPHFSHRCTSMNVMRDNYSMGGSVSGVRPPSILLSDVSPTPLPRPPLASISQLQEMSAVTGNVNAMAMVNANANPNANVNPSGNGNGAINNNNNSNHNGNGTVNVNGNGGGGGNGSGIGIGTAGNAAHRDSRTLPVINRINSRSVSQDSVYTILIRLPSDGASSNAANGGGGGGGGAATATTLSLQGDCAPSIKMIHEDGPTTTTANALATAAPPVAATRRPLPSRDSEFSLPLGRRMSHAQHDARLLNAKVIPKQLGKGGGAVGAGAAGAHALMNARNAAKKKKKSQEKRQESKAAKTLSAILLSFIITWTPYNILVLIKPLTTCSDCIPTELWDFFYALCYINSTINPMCYALCNATFRRTYVRILTCKWHTRNREGMVRGVYN